MRLVICLCFIAAASASAFADIGKEEWETFKVSYLKNYKSDVEEEFRMNIFMDNKNFIAKHNQKYEQGLVSYKLGVNQFADLLLHEFTNLMNGFNRSNLQASAGLNEARSKVGESFESPTYIKLPKSIDWRRKGAVTAVKDQGQCGSCWAFSATGALEGQNFLKTGKLISLSEQNLVDCSKTFGNNGCNGGWMDSAFEYVKENGGIDTESYYPYQGPNGDGICHFNKAKIGATDKGFVDIVSGDEAKLMNAVATIGPVSVAIDANHKSFMHYAGGVYNEPACSSSSLDHGVLVVGYGNERGNDYWLVKNSWSTNWGEGGYIKMSRNKNNQCGIATKASYPIE